MRTLVQTRARSVATSTDGFTLVELLMSISLLGVVMGATLSIMASASRTAGRDTERSATIREAQTGLSRMVRDLRQATAIDSATANTVRLRMRTATSSAGTAFQDSFVEYDCGTVGGGDCRRYQWLVSAGTTRPAQGTPVATNVLNAGSGVAARQIFSIDTGAGQGTVRLEVPAAGDQACPTGSANCTQYRGSVVLDDGFSSRNIGGA